MSAEHVADPGAGAEAGEHGKGAAVSETATTTDSTGVDKGAEIAGVASDGHSHAGQNGAAGAPEHPAAGGGESDGNAQVDTPNSGGTDHPENASGTSGGADQSRAPVETPNSGGTGTADDASAEDGGGASTHGTDTADSHSGGHSSAGSQNRP